ncbi:energy transducer TonB [Tamlana sp. 2201CG12-4]|uniref:energy transducer TonB n=1 Tax=Tamlana sp. 2201CG12-4 TaxID=3112582 RepID=UPI002DB6749B|nr:energy transducer TonB [Tamlana sp. 2201CG12-4]MEC3905801.1 energy transducer TonB [Tamlana sp. 2201CG12-4]
MKKSQKHDANLQKNTTLYFQIGLIVCLLATFGLLEMKFETTIPEFGEGLPPLDEPIPIDVPLIKTKVPEIVEPVQQKQRKQPESYKEVPNDTPENLFKEAFEEPQIDTPPLNPDDFVPPVEKPEESVNVRFVAIQDAPIYPGCEKAKGNEARKKCMSEKISKLVRRKFNGSDIASGYGLQGRQKIDVEFTIDRTGKVTGIKTRAPHPKLREEAERVINYIPEMTPGRQHDKNVGVIYNLPIIFQVE